MGDSRGHGYSSEMGQVVTELSQSMSWEAFCNEDDQREVPEPVCRSSKTLQQLPGGHASLGVEGRKDPWERAGFLYSLTGERACVCVIRRPEASTVNGGLIGHIQ